MESLLEDIRAFCKDHGLSDTRFGELAMNDRPFVKQLENGRDVRSSTVKRVREFMAEYSAEKRPNAREAA